MAWRRRAKGGLLTEEINGAEGRDPEASFSDAAVTGSSSRALSRFTAALRDVPACQESTIASTPTKSFFLAPGGCDCQSGKNSLTWHGGGNSLGIPPLRATHFL